MKVAAAEASLDELSLHLMAVASEQWAAPMLERAMAGMRSAYPTGATSLTIVDGLRALRDGDGMSASERLLRAVRDAADYALRFNSAVLVLLSEELAEGSGDEDLGEGDPARFIGRTAGVLDPFATSVAMLGRPGWSGEEAHLGVARQRFGRGGWVELLFDGTEFGGGFG